ncbi:MAG TPA: DUF1491 family protein [Novosphingobium sp.]|nr:DUF1491 family protein [Novosphingobium sp.]
MDARLPAHLEVAGLLRRAQAAGGFAMVLEKGEREGGTILVVLLENGANPRVYERMPSFETPRIWTISKTETIDNKSEFGEYLARRKRQDPDLWIIELDVANGERLIGLSTPAS